MKNTKYLKVFYLVAILFLLIANYAVAQGKKFSLTGKLKNLSKNETIYLIKGVTPSYDKAKWQLIDTTISKDGNFYFTGLVQEPDYYLIALNGNRWCTFILENGKSLIINGDANNLMSATIKGSRESLLYQQLLKNQKPLVEKMNSFADSADKVAGLNDTVKYNYFVSLNQKWANKIVELNCRVIKQHPDTYLSLSEMKHYWNKFSKEFVLDFLKQLPPDLKNHTFAKEIYYKKFQEEIDLKNVTKFYDFSLFDTSKNKISYNEYYGNYVLIDFWASWCKPCLANLGTIKDIYLKLKNKNFKVLSVSLDETMENWKKGIKKDPTPWQQVSDLKGWQSLPAKYYKIDEIPRYLILDVHGNPVVTDIKIDSIEKKLTELLTGSH